MEKHYLFSVEDEDSDIDGEEFIIGAKDYHEARELVAMYFPDVKVRYWHELTEVEAEMSGLDEY